MARMGRPDFQAIQSGLGRTIRRYRRDCPPMEAARLLLTYDGPGQPLVGLSDGARWAVYFDERGREVIAVGFDGEGPRGDAGRPIATLKKGEPVSAWVDRMRYYWAWRHPRFR